MLYKIVFEIFLSILPARAPPKLSITGEMVSLMLCLLF